MKALGKSLTQRKRGKCFEKIPKSLKIGQKNPGIPRKIAGIF
jgi:hypothetical protein